MFKSSKKAIAVLMALLMFSAALGLSVYAETNYFTPSDKTEHSPDFNKGRIIVNSVGFLTKKLIPAILSVFPNPGWLKLEDYEENTEFKGNAAQFSAEPTAQTWKAGYGSRSILPDDILSGDYNKVGSFSFPGIPVQEVVDDQRVSVVALDAGTGIALFVSLDGYGFTHASALALRESLKTAVAGKNVVSINVSASHCHSGVDIHGLGAPMQNAITQALWSFVTRKALPYESLNQKLIETLHTRAAEAVTEALAGVSEGTLSFGSIGAADLMFDKQEPQAFDPNINHIRFVPTGGADEIWMVNLGVHPTIMSSDDNASSADYPGMLAKLAKEQYGANVAFYNGAEVAITSRTPAVDYDETRHESMTRFAQILLDRIVAADSGSYTILEPILNIVSKEILVPVDNPLLWAFFKFQIVNNQMVATSERAQDNRGVTEIGFCELGKSLVIFNLPGEFSAELIWGGTQKKELSWRNSEWGYAPLAEQFPGKKVICFGLTNDMIGYIIPDNDYAAPLADSFAQYLGERNKHYEELLSPHSQAASNFVKEYIKLIDSVK